MNHALLCVLTLACLFSGGFGCSVTSEKPISKPIPAEYSVTEPQFRAALTHLLGPPLVDGNNVVELVTFGVRAK